MHSKEQLNEGILSYATDLVMAFRIVKILYQDWTSTNAYKLGIIDENGTKLRKPEGLEEKSAYSPFIRLVFKLKKLINAIPGGSTKIGSLAAAYALLRECEDIDLTKLTKEDIDNLFEDAPVNVSGGVAGAERPLGQVQRRNWKDQEKFAGCTVFEVESGTYVKCKEAKQKFVRWSNYINDEDGEIGQDILKFAKSYPGKGIVLKEKGTNAHVFLKNPY